ncbi:MAG TPA: FAD-dependent oxidoreductase, partial [bacterium]|nr:FAD-dependent oxidoreductase [bacterium]
METVGHGTSSSSPVAAIEQLRSGFAGMLIDPAHADYEHARGVWNGMITRRPALIARCTGVADVQAALAYARADGLPVAVRGGGHSAAGLACPEGGVVIDLKPMNQVEVDPQARIARAGGGATLAQFDAATQAHGL